MPTEKDDKNTENSDIQPNLNIYEKIQTAKKMLSNENIKKSGLNEYSNFEYYELSDFMPEIIKIFDELKLFSKVTFTNETAVLKIINTENPAEFEEYMSPMKDLEIKGANKIQCLGGVETYQRRYLYMSALDITENDMFDPKSGEDKGTPDDKKTPIKPANGKKASEKQIKLVYSILNEISKGYAEIGKKVSVDGTIQQMKTTLKINKELQEFSVQEAAKAIDYLTNMKVKIPKQDKVG
jgi:hypothetical protein